MNFIGKIFYCAAIVFLFNSCNKNKNTFFQNIPSSQTNINFKNTLKTDKLFNILYYLYYYNGAGVAIGDINNDGLPDIYFAANNTAGNKLYLNKGNFVFEDITQKAGVAGNVDWSTGVTMADINNDGYLDIYVSVIAGKYNLKGHNLLFINNKNGTFTESAEKYGLDFKGLSTQAAFFDYDHDGDLDCYLLNQSSRPHQNIVDTSNRNKYDSLSGDKFYENNVNKTGKFTDVSSKVGIYQSSLGYGLGIGIADINQDGWDDIYVGNDFHENDYYYINNGNGTFTESGAKHFKHYSRFSMGNDIADINNDGQPDIITVDMLPPNEKVLKTYGSDENADIYKFKLERNGYQQQFSKNCLQINNNNGQSFSETSLISGVSATDWSWSPLFADFNNDGNKDLLISSGIVKRPVDLDYIRYISDLDMYKGRQKTDAYDDDAIKSMPDGASHPFVFLGDGKANFKDESEQYGTANMKGYFNGAAYADLNNDGKVDIVINCIDKEALILKNSTPNKISTTIKLKGIDNKFGVGTKVWLFTKNKMQYQELMLTRGFQSSSEPLLHFGLDSIRTIDSMLIVWPSQKYQLVKNIPCEFNLTFEERMAGGVFNYQTFFATKSPILQDVTASINFNWQHQENDFWDFNKQYTLPHLESTRGPKIAVADIDKDGLDDFFVCGAEGQAGIMMKQNANGSFTSIDTTLFSTNKFCEGVDALFFDANGDSFPDLYVVSGGNHFENNNPLLADHLYINNGKGHFVESKTIPTILKNKSAVAVADIDHDGDLDLFVAGFTNANYFGEAQNSYIFINDGKANFSLANKSIANLDSIGMVTTATFADVNNDSWQDLIIAGEWMPIKVLINNKGTFSTQALDSTNGLWQNITITDVNGDGAMDILAGNWGHNTKLWAGKNGPLKLYVKDFDGNGSVEQIMCYTIDKNEYTFLAKDELERSLPVLKKYYLKYSEVAGKTVQYMFYDLFKNYKELEVNNLSSCCFLNNGKGQFTKYELPNELQLAPIFSFQSIKINEENDFIAAGNFYGVIPYEGRYDALLPTIFHFDKNKNEFVVKEKLQDVNDEVRDMKWIKTSNDKRILAIAKNNKKLQFLKQTSTK